MQTETRQIEHHSYIDGKVYRYKVRTWGALKSARMLERMLSVLGVPLVMMILGVDITGAADGEDDDEDISLTGDGRPVDEQPAFLAYQALLHAVKITGLEGLLREIYDDAVMVEDQNGKWVMLVSGASTGVFDHHFGSGRFMDSLGVASEVLRYNLSGFTAALGRSVGGLQASVLDAYANILKSMSERVNSPSSPRSDPSRLESSPS